MKIPTTCLCLTLITSFWATAHAGIVTVPPTPGLLLNISSRLDVGTNENVLIGGFIIVGSEPKTVLVRALGPSLPVQGSLADPILELHEKDGTVITNDNWKDNQATVEATFMAPTNDLESAIVVTLPPGPHTAIVRGKNDGTGIGLVEVYALGATGDSTLGNISTRGRVGTGGNVLIGGTMIGGTNPSQIIVRAMGPSLAQRGVGDVLADPRLELVDKNGTVLAQSDNWRESSESAIQATGLAPSDDNEAAVLATLPPDSYTAIVRSKGGTAGVGLVEVYRLPDRVTGKIDSSGGVIDFPGVASASFPSGAFSSDQAVAISLTSDPDTDTVYIDTASIFEAGERTPFEVRIKTGLVQPTTDVTVTVGIPKGFRDGVPEGSEIRAFGQNLWESSDEVLDTFELLEGRFLPSDTTATVTVPPWFFTAGRSPIGEFEAVLLLGTTPTRQPSSSIPAMLFSSRLDPNGPLETPLGKPRDAVTYLDLRDFLRVATPVGACLGDPLAFPFDGTFPITSRFGPRPNVGVSNFHEGTDYGTPIGTPVKAMHSGKITRVRVEVDPKTGAEKGYGQYIEITGTIGSTRYGHLKVGSPSVKVGDMVSTGQVIGLSGNSGGSTGAHLHIDYAPNGGIHDHDGHVDPAPCVGATLTGSITVSDNGSIADDAFAVYVNGTLLCTTQIGLSNTCAISNLRPGTALLGITAVVAPDDVGTFGVSLADGLTFSGGGTTRSGTLRLGETASFTINVPGR